MSSKSIQITSAKSMAQLAHICGWRWFVWWNINAKGSPVPDQWAESCRQTAPLSTLVGDPRFRHRFPSQRAMAVRKKINLQRIFQIYLLVSDMTGMTDMTDMTDMTCLTIISKEITSLNIWHLPNTTFTDQKGNRERDIWHGRKMKWFRRRLREEMGDERWDSG